MGRMPERARRWVFLTFLFFIPWVALNTYWVLNGEFRAPFWFFLTNALILFFGLGAPAIDRRFESQEKTAEVVTPTRDLPRRPRRRAA